MIIMMPLCAMKPTSDATESTPTAKSFSPKTAPVKAQRYVEHNLSGGCHASELHIVDEKPTFDASPSSSATGPSMARSAPAAGAAQHQPSSLPARGKIPKSRESG